MNLSIGIVGLPNVGKSTLFNALLKRQSSFAEASAGQAGSGGVARVGNFPFTTIEPNVGVVPVPDRRLESLAEIIASQNSKSEALNSKQTSNSNIQFQNKDKWPPIKPATVNFVDIAGLVKGASEGAGLGNKFLSHIREVSVIAHVVRAFTDPNIIREGSVGVKEDYEIIRTELALSDLESISKRKTQKSNPQLKSQNELLERLERSLNEGEEFDAKNLSKEDADLLRGLNLLSLKPEIMVLNVSEDQYSPDGIKEAIASYIDISDSNKDNVIVISANIESELAGLSEDEQREYLKSLGLQTSGLERLIQKAYEELGLISFLTAPASADASARQGGKWEVRAWTIKKGATALEASGEIHTDFMKKFIKAEVVGLDDFVQFGGWKGAREHGKALLEGRDYVVKDGDIIEFKIGT